MKEQDANNESLATPVLQLALLTLKKNIADELGKHLFPKSLLVFLLAMIPLLAFMTIMTILPYSHELRVGIACILLYLLIIWRIIIPLFAKSKEKIKDCKEFIDDEKMYLSRKTRKKIYLSVSIALGIYALTLLGVCLS